VPLGNLTRKQEKDRGDSIRGGRDHCQKRRKPIMWACQGGDGEHPGLGLPTGKKTAGSTYEERRRKTHPAFQGLRVGPLSGGSNSVYKKPKLPTKNARGKGAGGTPREKPNQCQGGRRRRPERQDRGGESGRRGARAYS